VSVDLSRSHGGIVLNGDAPICKTAAVSGKYYKYSGGGQRVRRIVNGVETWQVYGLEGELLAEYAQNAAPASPQKEYGYRNGQLLVEVTAGTGWGAPPVLNDNPLVINPCAASTDARFNSTDIDGALNRVTTVRYINDPQSTPGVDSYYDGYRGGVYQNIPDSKGRAWQVETLGQIRTTVDAFDVMGRVQTQRQQFWTGSAWGTSYQIQGSYNLAGQVTSQIYPSGRSVAYAYDQSGRLNTSSGNLGDGISRTYQTSFNTTSGAGCSRRSLAPRRRSITSTASMCADNCGTCV
jgi:YD repeat-containing protein